MFDMWGIYVRFFIKSQLVALLMGKKKKSVISIFVDDDVSNTFLLVDNGSRNSYCFSLELNSIDFDLVFDYFFDLVFDYFSDGEVIVHHGTVVNDAVCDLLLHSCKKWVECKKWKLD